MNYPYKEGWWETKDHKKMKISDMETSHIENTIKFLEKHHEFYDEEYGGMFGPDGDDIFYDYIDNSHLVNRKIKELEFELNKRETEHGND